MKLLQVMIAYHGDQILEYEDVEKYIQHRTKLSSFYYIQSLNDDAIESKSFINIEMTQNSHLN